MHATRSLLFSAMVAGATSCSLLPTSSTDCGSLGKCEPLHFVIGQPDEHSNNRLRYGLDTPRGVLVVGNKLLISDTLNHRVLIWNSFPPADGQVPDVVIGQPELTTSQINYQGVSARSLSSPATLASDGTRLLISDSGNLRVLVYNQIPTQNFAAADVVIGQADFATVALGIFGFPVPAGDSNFNSYLSALYNIYAYVGIEVAPSKSVAGDFMLILTDSYYNRTLIWDPIPKTNDKPAKYVLGQTLLTDSTMGSAGNKMTNPAGRPAVFGQHLLISDHGNNRLLYWDMFPTANGQTATAVYGQSAFGTGGANPGGVVTASSLWSPAGVFINSTPQLFAADSKNNRVLVWNSVPSTNQPPADYALGQPMFSTNSPNGTAAMNGMAVTAQTMKLPSDIWSGGSRTLVADSGNHRVLLWNSPISMTAQPADRAIGQPALTSNEADTSPTLGSSEFASPSGMCRSKGRLYVVDTLANRVLIWSHLPMSSSDAPDLVLGQPNLSSAKAQNGGLGAGSLWHPNGVSCDGDTVAVSDYGNSRVLIWNRPIILNQQPADVVVGQKDFVSNKANPSGPQTGLNGPRALQLGFGKLFVADALNHRVLIYNQTPTQNNATPDLVIGQIDLTKAAVNGGSVNYVAQPNSLFEPSGLYTDGTRLLISDTGNARVLIYSQIPTANGVAANMVLGQPTLTDSDRGRRPGADILRAPSGIALLNERLYIADAMLHRVLYWNQFPTQNDQSADGALGQPTLSNQWANDGGLRFESLQSPSGLLALEEALVIADTGNGRVVFTPFPTL